MDILKDVGKKPNKYVKLDELVDVVRNDKRESYTKFQVLLLLNEYAEKIDTDTVKLIKEKLDEIICVEENPDSSEFKYIPYEYYEEIMCGLLGNNQDSTNIKDTVHEPKTVYVPRTKRAAKELFKMFKQMKVGNLNENGFYEAFNKKCGIYIQDLGHGGTTSWATYSNPYDGDPRYLFIDLY